MRPLPARAERPSIQRIIEALRSLDLPEGKGAVVAHHSTRKSAVSAASRLRRKHDGFEFIGGGTDVLARPKVD